MDLSFEQTAAVELCSDLSNRIVGVTGGAGTGKTLVLGRAFRELKSEGKSVVLCAPTGRAAKRIQELTKLPAVTIHRLLEFPTPLDNDEDEPNEPRRNGQNPLWQRVVFVDEASMISRTLYDQLLDAARHSVVRFFGDNNQLPPVDDTSDPPFVDVLNRFPSIELTFNFRSGDAIVSNALRILKGQIPLRNDRFEIIYADDPIKTALNRVTQTYKGFDSQLIVPTRNGDYGTKRINPSLQLQFNGAGDSIRIDRLEEQDAPLVLREGDKFIWTKNDYNHGLFNGEIGYVSEIDFDGGALTLVTPEAEITVPPRAKYYNPYIGYKVTYDPRKAIELGYAVTTHKAQGSEFDHVMYVITRRHGSRMLNRNNFYTAVTRARHTVTIIADRAAMFMALKRA